VVGKVVRTFKKRKANCFLILNNSKISRAELCSIIGINPSAIQKQIIMLKERGIIKRIGPDN
jgi:predicted HTH transcriptional regulator